MLSLYKFLSILVNLILTLALVLLLADFAEYRIRLSWAEIAIPFVLLIAIVSSAYFVWKTRTLFNPPNHLELLDFNEVVPYRDAKDFMFSKLSGGLSALCGLSLAVLGLLGIVEEWNADSMFVTEEGLMAIGVGTFMVGYGALQVFYVVKALRVLRKYG